MGDTATYSVGIACIYHGFDASMFPGRLMAESIFPNESVDILTYVRDDNSDAARHEASINSITEETMSGGLQSEIESNFSRIDGCVLVLTIDIYVLRTR